MSHTRASLKVVPEWLLLLMAPSSLLIIVAVVAAAMKFHWIWFVIGVVIFLNVLVSYPPLLSEKPLSESDGTRAAKRMKHACLASAAYTLVTLAISLFLPFDGDDRLVMFILSLKFGFYTLVGVGLAVTAIMLEPRN